MALQGQGAYRKNSLTNLQVELPAVVIGGGLTAIDTATELQAYYVTQVEKDARALRAACSGASARQRSGRASTRRKRETVRTWLDHGRMVQAERAAAQAAGRPPDFARLVRSWGGVTIVYRKRLQDSPAYRLNHEEVIKSLEEGIGFVECMSPDGLPARRARARARAAVHAHGAGRRQVEGHRREGRVSGARRDGRRRHEPERRLREGASRAPSCSTSEHALLRHASRRRRRTTARCRARAGERTAASASSPRTRSDGRFISFYGDAHPVFAGNVVKAMASARLGYREIARLFEREVAAQDLDEQAERENAWVRFAEVLEDGLRAEVVDAIRLADRIVEVIVRAPMAARNFRPGQFYRVQNYEGTRRRRRGHPPDDGGPGAHRRVDRSGARSDLADRAGDGRLVAAVRHPRARRGDRAHGPDGHADGDPARARRCCSPAAGSGNAVLFSIAAAMKARGNRVIYFAGYKRAGDLFKRRYIEDACDLVVWSVDEGRRRSPRTARRTAASSATSSRRWTGYARGELGATPIRLQEVDRLICIGSDRMMDAVRAGASRRAARRAAPRATSPSARSTRRCSAC